MKPVQRPTTLYEIRVEGCLTEEWSGWFEGLSIQQENDGTLLAGPLPDQAALYGLLKKVRDLGLTLVSVNRIEHSHKENKL
jgi:hypothetical protein